MYVSHCQIEHQKTYIYIYIHTYIYIHMYMYICIYVISENKKNPECQMECQNTYQIECRIYGQNMCQIEYHLVGITQRTYVFICVLVFHPTLLRNWFWASPILFQVDKHCSSVKYLEHGLQSILNPLHLLAQLGMIWMTAEDARVANHEPQMIPSQKLAWLIEEKIEDFRQIWKLRWYQP